jgi:hypothetical protein
LNVERFLLGYLLFKRSTLNFQRQLPTFSEEESG